MNQQRNANLNDSNNTNNSVETNSDDENPPSALPDHYDDIEPLDEYTKNYGYNPVCDLFHVINGL